MLIRHELGGTGMRVSRLGLGTVKFGRNERVKYPAGFDLPSDREITALLHQAMDAGINLIDTAPAYGGSEQRLGKLLPEREHWLLCTKVGEIFEAGRSRFDFSASHTRASIERSLRHLRSDRLDIVLIHSDGNDLAILDRSDCLETLARLRERGLIRAVGMSSKTVAGGLRAIDLVDVLMLTYNRADPSQARSSTRPTNPARACASKKASPAATPLATIRCPPRKPSASCCNQPASAP